MVASSVIVVTVRAVDVLEALTRVGDGTALDLRIVVLKSVVVLEGGLAVVDIGVEWIVHVVEALTVHRNA